MMLRKPKVSPDSFIGKINRRRCPFPVQNCDWCLSYSYLMSDVDRLLRFTVELTDEEYSNPQLASAKGYGGAFYYFDREFQLPLRSFCVNRSMNHKCEKECCLKKLEMCHKEFDLPEARLRMLVEGFKEVFEARNEFDRIEGKAGKSAGRKKLLNKLRLIKEDRKSIEPLGELERIREYYKLVEFLYSTLGHQFYNPEIDEKVRVASESKFFTCSSRAECKEAYCEYYDLCKALAQNPKRPFYL